jgi:pimeloyl-ACP methyl ester carboxylesterase
VVLIHDNDESSLEWYAWVPRMAQEYRLIRPDLPGLGHSNVPRGFEYSLFAGHGVSRQGMRGPLTAMSIWWVPSVLSRRAVFSAGSRARVVHELLAGLPVLTG